MGDETEKRRREIHNLSIQTENYPRDLLQRFSDRQKSQSEQEQHDNEEIELSLGLSLGGRFGVDKNKKLIRSSSIAGPIPILREEELTEPSPVPYTTLIRASSLPTETEDVWRKKKEMQILRRLEAKQRRSKKLRSLRTDKIELNRDEDDKSKDKVRMQLGGGGGGGLFWDGTRSRWSVVEEVLCEAMFKGSNSCGESPSPSSNHSSNQEPVGSSGTKTSENSHRIPMPPLQKNLSAEKRAREQLGMNTTTEDNMPCVFAKGDGPNGKRIEGILYRYGKGAEVRIMCVCHGSFFSPAEFVKHAGGGDVDHPLRHIVINPSPSFL